ncbi:MAG TPA: FkbM family methyltransferase [Mucilaginibacter sp.]|nr:FkbM family methyltransferase [Mucilaginibacter sp.]
MLIYSAKSINVNLLEHGLVQIEGTADVQGELDSERRFMKELLPKLIGDKKNQVFFDVGANTGNYSKELSKSFPTTLIYSFEPVRETYEKLVSNTENSKIRAVNLGMSDKIGDGEIYNTVNNANSEWASMYKDVFSGVFQKDARLETISFKMDTIDNFCSSEGISRIDFLKIDVEGHELFVLKGAGNMLLNKAISVIQFEFNSHDVFSRVFLRDFYLLLKGFDFYRITQNGIVKLGPYRTSNEIFVLQNFLAVQSDLSSRLDSLTVA